MLAGWNNVTWGQESKTLRVATWGGSWRDAIDRYISSKLKASGVAVEYDLGGPSDNLAKLIAARRAGQYPFSVMEASSYVPSLLAQSNMMEKLNYSRLPNSQKFPAWARGEIGVTYAFSAEGIVYNKKLFEKANIPPPQRYSDLADTRLQGRVAFPNVSHNQHWNAVVGLAYENSGSESKLEAALPLISKISPLYYYTSSIELGSRFGSGEVWAAPFQAGWTLRLRRQGIPLDIQYLNLGKGKRGAISPVELMIVQGSPNPNDSYEYVNQFLSPESQYEFGNATGTTPVSLDARTRMAQEPDVKSISLLSDADIESAFRIDWSALDARRWLHTWNTWSARR
jgi:putative spermidine/putrescine transport system substrate-binding protein